MATKTHTARQTVFSRIEPLSPNNQAIFAFDTDSSRPGLTQISLPEGSAWSPGLHWHEQHIEIFKVVKGRILLKLGDVSKVVTQEDGPQRVEKFVVHDFMRADWDAPDADKDSGDVITEEWTDPADGIKHLFFRNVFSTLQDSEKYWGKWTYLQALFVAAHYDEFIQVVPPGFPQRLSYAATHTLYATVCGIGRLLGLSPWHEEYTPEDLRRTATLKKAPKTD